jgi:chromate transporter
MAAEHQLESMEPERGTAREVFAVFLKLGLTSFGGPIAHLSYFHRELIERRRWLSESQYAQLLGLCQFVPGPASSQLGFTLLAARRVSALLVVLWCVAASIVAALLQ